MRLHLLTLLVTFGLVGCAPAVNPAALRTGTVEYQVDGNAFEGYLVRAEQAGPLVLLVHDWDGLTEYEMRRARMLGELGYTVFAADLYGKGVRPTALEDKRRCTSMLYEDRPRMRRYLRGALQAARRHGADTGNAVAVGYCFGGTAVLELARSGADLKGFASFHGGLDTPKGQSYDKTRGYVLVFHGTADDGIPMEQFAALAEQLEKTGVSHEMITYGGAPHAFTVFGSDRYRKQADRLSWQRFTQFLEDTLKE